MVKYRMDVDTFLQYPPDRCDVEEPRDVVPRSSRLIGNGHPEGFVPRLGRQVLVYKIPPDWKSY